MLGGNKIILEGRLLEKILRCVTEEKPALYSSFQKALEKVFQWEGVKTDDASDSGGLTMFGVSLAFLRQGKIDLNNDGIVDRKDVMMVDKEEAERIYKAFFWDKLQCDKISNFLIQRQLFDIGVNMGNSTSVKLLQRCLNSLGENLKVDGLIGSKTLSVIKTKDCTILNNLMVEERIKKYNSIVEKYPKNSKFLRGWVNRAKSYYV